MKDLNFENTEIYLNGVKVNYSGLYKYMNSCECLICNSIFLKRNFKRHQRSKKHIKKSKESHQRLLDEMDEKNKNYNIEIIWED